MKYREGIISLSDYYLFMMQSYFCITKSIIQDGQYVY